MAAVRRLLEGLGVRRINRRLLWVISPFLAAIAVLMITGAVGTELLAGARAFVGGESLWSKAQKQASYFLERYARGHDERDYRLYRENVDVILGDRAARLELDKARPDLAAATQGFLRGRNHPDDVPGMIRLYRDFGSTDFMAEPIRIWAAADARIADLDAVAAEMHRRIAAGSAGDAQLQPLLERAEAIGQQLTPLEEAFSRALAEASRETELILLLAMTALPVTLAALAFGLSRWASRRFDEVVRALHESEERYKLAVAGTNDGIWDWNMVDGTTYYSPRAKEILGYGPEDLGGRVNAVRDLVHPDDQEACRAVMRSLLRNAESFEIELRLRLKSGTYRWFLARGGCVKDAGGRTMRMAGSIKDISQQKATQAAIARQARQQGLLSDFGQAALENADIEQLFARAATVAALGVDAPYARLLVYTPDRSTLVLKGAVGWEAAWTRRPGFDADVELQERLAAGARPWSVFDELPQDLARPSMGMLQAHAVRSGIETLVCGAQGAYAVLGAYAREPAEFSEEGARFLHGIANTLASAMDRKVAEERLTYMAQFDSLTGLPNRTMFLDCLARTMTQAGREKAAVGVLFVDLDRFKIVNDTMGHGAGDRLLLLVARRLQNCVRAGDIVGRLGGDEFAVALAGLMQIDDAGVVAAKIVESMSNPFEIEGQTVYVSASIGISVFPGDGGDADQLLRKADTAMYRAKEAGRNTHRYYHAEMNERSLRRLSTEVHLRNALQRDEFFLLYQPKARLTDGTISGYEALLRWRHPERGAVAPGEFISILEETGLIIDVGAWAIRAVCEQVVAWRAAGLALQPVAVNLSARQFHQKHLEDEIGEIIAATGVPPEMLAFELTESMLMSDAEAAARTLERMKAYGVGLSVDDFGTGYSSLAYLKRFPLDELKIDRTFVRDVAVDAEDATIARSIINLAHSLKLSVVAEGVETEAQLDFLRANRCDQMQGYYFARPMAPEDCARAMKDGRVLRLPRMDRSQRWRVV